MSFTRPVMTAAELREHQVAQYGRDYSESDDGYSDMAAEETKRNWRALAGWARDGYDLGDWPYVVIYTRYAHGAERPFELMQICEGDRTVYSFETMTDRDAATDYLFLWYGADRRYRNFPVTYETRELLDAGELEIADEWRGPYRAVEVL